METRVCPIPNHPNSLSYTSAPSSPGRSTSTTLNAYFFSVPTSPSRSRSLSRNASGNESDSTTPGSDDFKFGSLEYPQVYVADGFHQHRPVMAYADELFYGGRMLPLKLPPRLQSADNSTCSYRKWNGGRRIISPGSRSLRLKIPFRHRSLWNDEFDPFVVALEKVKENHHHQHHELPRRSRSLSPLKWGCGLSLRRSKSMGSDGPASLRRVNEQSPIEAIPLAVELLRPAGGKGGGDKAEARRQRIKRFLLKSASFGWKTNKLDKEECRTALLWSPHEYMEEATTTRPGNALVRISRGIKSLVKHRPRLFCKTFGLQRAPKMN